jgi:3D (Asp-Asp-Asp) domain-containing protein
VLLSRSSRRKIVVTCGGIVGFWLLHEVTIIDSRYAAEQAQILEETTMPAPGLRLRFKATAYCKGETTASGAAVRTGIAASDPAILPVGSVVQVDLSDAKYSGIYTIMDTGPAVQGRMIDIYMWSCHEALRFGQRDVQVRVLRLGWNPQASGRRADVLFRRREDARPAAVAPPLAPVAPAAKPAPAPPPAVPKSGSP